MNISEEDALNLSGKAWVPIPRLSRTIPFGYKPSEADPDILNPVIFELEALEKAKEYRKKGYSLVKVSNWLTQVTGRKISHVGLKNRIESDSKRRRKAQTLANWAKRYREALQKAKENDERLGNDTSIYDDAIKDLVSIATQTRT